MVAGGGGAAGPEGATMTASHRPTAYALLRPLVATLLVSMAVTACTTTERNRDLDGATTSSTERIREVIRDEDSAAPSVQPGGLEKEGVASPPRAGLGPRLQTNFVVSPMWGYQVHRYIPQPE